MRDDEEDISDEYARVIGEAQRRVSSIFDELYIIVRESHLSVGDNRVTIDCDDADALLAVLIKIRDFP